MRRLNKKAQWQNYLLPAIMAVIVLGISFFFIFNEYFTEDEINREVCRESIVVRSALPEASFLGATANSMKNDFPLKCKTNVIEVTEDDVTPDSKGKRKIDKIIGDALTECWYIFLNGDGQIFASDVIGFDISSISIILKSSSKYFSSS